MNGGGADQSCGGSQIAQTIRSHRWPDCAVGQIAHVGDKGSDGFVCLRKVTPGTAGTVEPKLSFFGTPGTGKLDEA